MEPVDRSPKVPEDRPSEEEVFVALHSDKASKICEKILGEATESNKSKLKREFTAFCALFLTNSKTPPELVAKIKAAKAKLDSIGTNPASAAPSPASNPASDFQLRHASDLVAAINTSLTPSNNREYKEDLDNLCYPLLGCTNIPAELAFALNKAYQKLATNIYRSSQTPKKPTTKTESEITTIKLTKAPYVYSAIISKTDQTNIAQLKRELDEIVYSLLGKTEVSPTLADKLRKSNEKLKTLAKIRAPKASGAAAASAPMLHTKEAATGGGPKPLTSKRAPPLLSTVIRHQEDPIKLCNEILTGDLKGDKLETAKNNFYRKCLPMLDDTTLAPDIQKIITDTHNLLKMME